MSKEELLLKYWRELPPDHQQELIHFAEFLHTKATTAKPRPHLKGLPTDLDIDLRLDTAEEALENLLTSIKDLSSKSKIIQIQANPFTPYCHPWMKFATRLKDNPLLDEIDQSIVEFRLTLDQEVEA